MTILNEDYQLNNGVKIPKLALGTWLLDDATAEKAVTRLCSWAIAMLILLKPTQMKRALAAAFNNPARLAMRSL